MLLSFTPVAFNFAMVPATSASMTVLFHREWTMATRRGVPSSLVGGGAGPLIESDIVVQSYAGLRALRVAIRHRFKRVRSVMWSCLGTVAAEISALVLLTGSGLVPTLLLLSAAGRALPLLCTSSSSASHCHHNGGQAPSKSVKRCTHLMKTET